MKKLLSLGILSLSIVTLASCSQSTSNSSDTSAKTESKTKQSNEAKVPSEYTVALKKAESYLKTMPMSKDRLYDQLTSEIADKFPAEAAQYAVDNIKADWNEQAAKAAKNYRDKIKEYKNARYHLHQQNNIENAEENMEKYYDMKEKLLSKYEPTMIHKQYIGEKKQRVYSYEKNMKSYITKKEML